MHSLTPITALGASEPRVDKVGSVTLSENTQLALASVAARLGQEKACQTALGKVLGSIVPGPGKALLAQPYAAVWMGPDQWMIGADFETSEDIAAEIKTALKQTASVTEQTDAWACFDLRGEGVQDVLELLCNVNLRKMQPGDAQRTSIHHLGCFVICGDPTAFVRIIGPRASAGSLHHAILTAMKSAL